MHGRLGRQPGAGAGLVERRQQRLVAEEIRVVAALGVMGQAIRDFEDLEVLVAFHVFEREDVPPQETSHFSSPCAAPAPAAASGAKVSIIKRTSSPSGYRIGQVAPLATYSSTFATHSRGVPDAVIICTASSGTSRIALWISSGPAGHVSTLPICSMSAGSTPLAFMMWGCCPRYWVSSSRERSRARSRSSSTEHTTSWGRSMSSSDLPARSAPMAIASSACLLYSGPTM